jgi:hypothetical protein
MPSKRFKFTRSRNSSFTDLAAEISKVPYVKHSASLNDLTISDEESEEGGSFFQNDIALFGNPTSFFYL